MLGWFSALAARASRSKRCRTCAFETTCAGRNFRATFRPSRVSMASYTTPMPPWPSFSSTRKWEIVVSLNDRSRHDGSAAMSRAATSSAGAFDECAGRCLISQERIDLGAECGIVAAGCVEQTHALHGRERQSLVKHLLDPSPAVNVHACRLDPTHGATTPWRASSPASRSPARWSALQPSLRR